MGGSRCTYRNCTVRSDGIIHMFHYPVYEKIRCHQWIVNAHRLDFLNLKLSQVRNRVVCQHHFKDECFMNFKKEKLTYYAIPTEDGPFCETFSDNAAPAEQVAVPYSIVLNDIDDHEKYSKRHSKATTSMIYADFLTNGDMWEKRSLNETIWNNMVVTSKENNSTDKKKKTVLWHSLDASSQKKENQKPPITLSELIEDTSNTKITEFENPLLAGVNLDENKDNVEQNKNIRSYKKSNDSKKSDNNIVKEDLNCLLTNQATNDVVINQEQACAPGPHLNNLLVDQDNNAMIDNFNNYVGTSNIIIEKNTGIILPSNQEIQTLDNKNNLHLQQPLELITTSNDYFAIIQNPKDLVKQVESNQILNNEQLIQDHITIDQWKANQNQNVSNLNVTKKKPKVTILSEKIISDPVLVEVELQPVSPSIYIHNIPKKKNVEIPTKNIVEKWVTNKNNECEKLHTNEMILPIKEETPIVENKFISEVKRNDKLNENLSKSPIIRHKIAPERVAAIEKKRNFNKRLRDIIEICLDRLDDQDNKTAEDVKVSSSRKDKDQKEKAKSDNQNIGTYLSKQAELPDVQEYMMKFLEAKMKMMQDVLLSKIEQNSQRIVELKNSVTHSPPVNKSLSTQTPLNEESLKKQLYQQISKFLSPNTNSLVYEELFINKYGQELSNQPDLPPKRRKRT